MDKWQKRLDNSKYITTFAPSFPFKHWWCPMIGIYFVEFVSVCYLFLVLLKIAKLKNVQ